MPKYEKGCLWEEYPWAIELNVNVRYCEKTVCHHCERISPIDPRWSHWRGGKIKSEESEGPQWICPAVVSASNQAKHDSTGVCLLCILERAKELGIEPEGKKAKAEGKCPECNGKGKRKVPAVSSVLGVIGHTVIKCEKCRGSGRIEYEPI